MELYYGASSTCMFKNTWRWTIYVALYMVCMYSGTAAENRHQVNYGVMFEELQPLYSAADFWTHTFIVDTLPAVALKHHIYKCACQEYTEVLKKISSMQRETIEIANKTSADTLELIDNINANNEGLLRTRRSKLSFLSRPRKRNLGRGHSKDFIRKIASHITEVDRHSRKMQRQFNEGANNFTSFMQTSNNRVDSALERIDMNHNLLLDMATDFEKNITNILRLNSWLLSILVDQFGYHTSVRTAFRNLYDGFVSLINGHLSPLILDQDNLRTVIQKVARSVSRQRPRWHLVHTTPSYYYKHAHFAIHRSDAKILLTLRFPVAIIKQPFRLFKLTTFPVPVSPLSTDGTSVVALPDYIAIPSGGFDAGYLRMSSGVLGGCDKDDSFIHCHLNLPLSPVNGNQCELALFNGDKNNIYNFCNFRFSPKVIAPTVFQLNTSHILLINISHADIKCDAKPSKRVRCNFCIVYLPCTCSLTSPFVSISERLSDCHKDGGQFSVDYPANYIWIQKYFAKASVEDVELNGSFTKSFNLSLNIFQNFHMPFSSAMLNDKGFGLDLDDVISAIKSHKPVYLNISPRSSEQNMCSCDESRVAFALAISAICLAGIITITGMIICVRMYRIMVTVSRALEQDQRVKCKPVSSDASHVACSRLPRAKSMPSMARYGYNIAKVVSSDTSSALLARKTKRSSSTNAILEN